VRKSKPFYPWLKSIATLDTQVHRHGLIEKKLEGMV
jgi:hypothetical protein